ncbi:MAG: hypothetical protein ACTHOD_01605 [Motilibacteraceae bacterium]
MASTFVRRRLLLTGALTAIVVIPLSGCGSNQNADSPFRTGTSAQDSAVGEATTSAVRTRSPSATLFPASVLQSDLYQSLTPQQQAQVKSYHAMSLNEFEQLPLEQRLAYAQFVYDVYEPGAMAQLQKYESRVLPAPDTLSEQNTGQEIVNNDDIKRSVAFWVLSNGGETGSINENNRLDAQKMESLRSRFVSPSEVKGNNLDTSVYDQAIEDLQNATSLMAGNGAGYDYYIATAMKESPTITGPTEEPTKYVHALYNGETT